MQGLTEGRIVCYTLGSGDLDDKHQGHVGEKVPAMVVAVFGGGTVNLTLFLDGLNHSSDGALTKWATSRAYSEAGEPNTWKWPERV